MSGTKPIDRHFRAIRAVGTPFGILDGECGVAGASSGDAPGVPCPVSDAATTTRAATEVPMSTFVAPGDAVVTPNVDRVSQDVAVGASSDARGPRSASPESTRGARGRPKGAIDRPKGAVVTPIGASGPRGGASRVREGAVGPTNAHVGPFEGAVGRSRVAVASARAPLVAQEGAFEDRRATFVVTRGAAGVTNDTVGVTSATVGPSRAERGLVSGTLGTREEAGSFEKRASADYGSQ